MADPVNGLLAARMDPERRRRIGNALMAQQYDRATPQDAPVTERAGLFPLATYANGQTGIAWPGIVATPVEKMAQVLRGEITPGTPEFNEAGFDIAGAAMVGGLAAARPRGSLGMSGRPTEGQGIRAYHGSPHDFDRFDMSKIGTGEGAQAYGHGLYFAENEGVARGYKDRLTTVKNMPIMGQRHFIGDAVVKALDRHGGDRAAAIAELEKGLEVIPATNPRRQSMETLLADLKAGKDEAGLPAYHEGKMYEVNIKANPDDFLDWDKPLSQQSEKVRGALQSGVKTYTVKGANGYDLPIYPFGKQPNGASPFATTDRALAERIAAERGGQLVEGTTPLPEKSGKEVYGSDLVRTNSARSGQGGWFTSDMLRDAGIPGIKYLDQGSRPAGEGSRNYVVFDANLIEILRKYGLLGMLGAGGMAQELMKPSKPNIPDDAA